MDEFRADARQLRQILRMNRPSASKFCDCVAGLKMRNQGCASQPVEADHCHPPLLAARMILRNLSSLFESPIQTVQDFSRYHKQLSKLAAA
jgi:hypothetical protein